MKEILETYKKVEKALDIRFEKDIALYVSKEDSEKIKENLYKNSFQNLKALESKFGKKIVSKVILKNSWLIELDKRNKIYLKDLFKNVDDVFLREIGKSIVDDKVFSTVEFKDFFKNIYIQSLTPNECIKIYQDYNQKKHYRLTALKRVLEEEQDILKFIKHIFRDYPELLEYANEHRGYYIEKILKNNNPTQKDFDYILKQINSNKDRVWINALLVDKEKGLKSLIDYISKNLDFRDNKTKLIIRKVLKLFSDTDNFVTNVEKLYKKFPSIRYLFIDMLEALDNKDLTQTFIKLFEAIGIPNSETYRKKIQTLKGGNKKTHFEDTNEIIENLSSHNINKLKNRNTLNWFNYMLKNSSSEIKEELFNEYQDMEYVQIILSYHFANFLKYPYKNNSVELYKKITSKSGGEPLYPEYIDLITEYIEILFINNELAENFLKEFDKIETLLKLNDRS